MIGPWHPFGEGPHGLKNPEKYRKTPQVDALPGMTPLGIKPYAQILAEAPLKPSAPQQPADVGLFSDDAAQTDLIDLLRK